jgi:DNA adenine methylase
MLKSMKLPQPIQYQGSKRKLAPLILEHIQFPVERLVEPFAGSAAVSIAASAYGKAKSFWLNDLNAPLTRLLNLIVEKPESISEFYEKLWLEQFKTNIKSVEHYYQVRELFNKTNDEKVFLYLLARCVKGAVRYNGEGYFNQSPDKRRNGTKPNKMRDSIYKFSKLLDKRVMFTYLDYREVFQQVTSSDLVYLDPPYQGVCGDKDSRYYAQIKYDAFVEALYNLNKRNIPYLLSYDGKRGQHAYGNVLPSCLYLTKIELVAGRSTQATLLGKSEMTIESLYLSPELSKLNQSFLETVRPSTQIRTHSSTAYGY